ncbi:MAG: hypothetical protein HZB13_00325 [Acidobacteria bacterium]|nr:hypothetical protein [Acidobacteriota bacterium]
MAAINAAGYDADINSPNNHPLRAALRQWVTAHNPSSLNDLRRFFQAHRRETPAAELGQYVAWALSVDGPPSFNSRFSPNQVPPQALALEGLGPLLARFYSEAALDQAWKQAQPSYDEAIARYHQPVSQAVFDSNAYLRNPTSGARGRRFQIFIDLLAAPNFVQTLSLADDYFVVITPSPEPRVRDVRHAYLHYLIDPLAIRNAAALDKKRALGDFALASPILDEAYRNDFTLLAGMSLVKAVESRLDATQAPSLVSQAMSEGFVLTAAFHDALLIFEKQDQSLALYLPRMIADIDRAREDRRIAQVQFASQRSARVVPVQAPKPVELSAAAQAAADAERLYEKRDLPAARAACRRVLEQPAPRPLQARAYFALARIAALEKQPGLSQQLFERSLELDPEPYERAWSHVYLARLATAAQDSAAALLHYQSALAVQGASEGARKAAQTEMQSPALAPKPSPDHQ